MSFDPYIKPAADEAIVNNSAAIEKLIKSVFSTDDGLKLIGYLESITILRPVMPVNESAYYGYFREGQNDIVRQLLQVLQDDQTKPSVAQKARLLFRKLISKKSSA